MVKVIGVRFRDVGKLYYFDPAGFSFRAGDRAIVETARGVECGYVGMGVREVPEEKIVKPLKPVVRKATDEDIALHDANRQKEKEAYAVCKRKIAERKLDMKLVDVEYTFDGQRILFYFTADGRVDFRELVKDLATVFRTRIELRQIGVRDESKLLGGMGMCGKPFCCATFLFDFQPVSIKMAKEQGKSLNPAKISGTCGRLMCCLKYEQDVYEELSRLTPRVGAIVRTANGGEGMVVENNILASTVRVRFMGESAPRVLPSAEVTVIGGKGFKKSANGEEPAAPAPAAQPSHKNQKSSGGRGKGNRPRSPQPPKQPAAPGAPAAAAAPGPAGESPAPGGDAPKPKRRRRRPRRGGDKKAEK